MGRSIDGVEMAFLRSVAFVVYMKALFLFRIGH